MVQSKWENYHFEWSLFYLAVETSVISTICNKRNYFRELDFVIRFDYYRMILSDALIAQQTIAIKKKFHSDKCIINARIKWKTNRSAVIWFSCERIYVQAKAIPLYSSGARISGAIKQFAIEFQSRNFIFEQGHCISRLLYSRESYCCKYHFIHVCSPLVGIHTVWFSINLSFARR